MDLWVYMFIQRAFSKHVPTMSRAPCADAYIYPNYVSRAINWRSQPQNTRPIIAILEKTRHEKSLHPLW